MKGRSCAPPAKIVRPPCPGALPRSRLFRLLDRARRRPAVWVCGPPGAGKTTLVSGYVEARRIPCLWYRADGGDADVGTFYHYLGLSAKAAVPGGRAPLPLPPPEFRSDPGTLARRFFEGLGGRLRRPSLIVFDDLHEIPDGSSFFDVLRDGAESLPAGVTLVLISRTEPPASLVRLRARGMLARIGWDDLRLTAAETKKMASRRGMKSAGGDQWRRLHLLTDGWAAGVVLALEAAKRSGEFPPRAGGGAPEEIFDFFAGEILDRLDDRSRKVLLAASFLPETTASLAEKAFGLREAGPVLSSLARQNAFVERRPGAETTYRFHSLFREYLLAQARETFSAAEILRLRRSAAAALEEGGRPEEARGLLRETEDWEGLSRLIRDRAPALFAQGRGQTLAEWLSELPDRIRDSDPWLTYWWARAGLAYDPDRSRRDFDKAFRDFVSRREAAGAFLAWAGAVEAIIYGSEGLKPLDPWISSLDGLLASFGGFPDEAVSARTTLAALKALSLRQPALPSAPTWAENAEGVARTAADASLKIEALVNLAYYWYHGGEFRRTAAVLDSLRELAGRRESPPLSRLAVAWVEAAHANMNALYDQCLEAVAAGLELASRTGIRVMDYMLMGHGALAALHKGDAKAARRHLAAMAASLGSARPWEAAFYHFGAAWEALGRKEVALARLHSDSCLSLGERIGNPWTEALAHVQQAFVLREEGEIEACGGHLEAARLIGEGHGLAFILFLCRLAEGLFLLDRAEEEKARAALREGMRIGREKGFDGVFIWRPGFLERVAMICLERGIEVDYARWLVRHNRLLPEEDRQDLESWPWPVRISTLGRFEVLRDGKPLGFTPKVPQRPLLLLKALIALGGRDVPVGRLTDLLWPESDGDMAAQAFRANVVRLRRLLGREEALTVREGRLSLDARHCFVDVWALDRLCRRVEEHRQGEGGGGEEDLEGVARRAVDLYRGPFLEKEGDREWTDPLRQHLRTLFLRCLLLAGERLERRGDVEAAASLYRKGLRSDELVEDLYRRLMSCYGRLGRTAEAAEVYRRCRRTMKTLLGTGPSPETEMLARSVLPLRKKS